MTEFSYVGTELELFAEAKGWKAYLESLLRPYIRGRVLEVGAGLGATSKALWNETVSTWTCLEPDARFERALQQVRLGPQGVEPAVVTGTLADIPSGQLFDAIMYIDVLEHIREDAEELMRASGRLAPGGSLIVVSPAFQFAYSEFDRALGHERRYTKETLKAAFPKGLTPSLFRYVDSVGLMLNVANRVMLRQSVPNRRQILIWDRVVLPFSRVLDPVLGRAFGRSVVAAFRK